MISALLLDLDDTLYPEAEYVVSGFRVVARAIAARCGAEPGAVHAFMLEQLADHGRGRIFDAALVRFGLPLSAQAVQELVTLYRSHRPSIALHVDAAAVLPCLRADYRLAVVTDGLPQMQRNKILALGLDERVDAVVYCWEHDAVKPAPGGYRLALDLLGVEPRHALVVGDRPDHDLAAASAVGCRAMRVRRGRFAAQPSQPFAAIGELPDLGTLPALLRDLRDA